VSAIIEKIMLDRLGSEAATEGRSGQCAIAAADLCRCIAEERPLRDAACGGSSGQAGASRSTHDAFAADIPAFHRPEADRHAQHRLIAEGDHVTRAGLNGAVTPATHP
jgi:hypothetical protein